MLLRAKRNRRRIDVAKKRGEIKEVAGKILPWVIKAAVIALSTGLCTWGWIAGWQWAKTSPTFGMKELVFSGLSRATENELARLGGLAPGLNLVAIDLDAVERSLAAHPWVKSVSVRRQLPSTLRIDIDEHVPVAALAMGDLYWLNESAEPFKRAKADEGVDLPLITGIDRDTMVNQRERALVNLKTAVELIGRYNQYESAKTQPLSEIHVEGGALTIITTSGEEARFNSFDLDGQLSRLVRVRAELTRRQLTAQVIRLNNRVKPGSVTVQLSGEGSEGGDRRGR